MIVYFDRVKNCTNAEKLLELQVHSETVPTEEGDGVGDQPFGNETSAVKVRGGPVPVTKVCSPG